MASPALKMGFHMGFHMGVGQARSAVRCMAGCGSILTRVSSWERQAIFMVMHRNDEH